jgi:hypothetical protein
MPVRRGEAPPAAAMKLGPQEFVREIMKLQ